jgi:hypothetical protein
MKVIHEYFKCDGCDCKNFKLIYNFSLRFHGINFSDDPVYDRLVDEIYQCVDCNKTFTKDQVEKALEKIKKKHKNTRLE